MSEQIKPKPVRRFAFDAESMYETEHGKYVLYSAHAETVQQLQQRNDRLLAVAKAIAKLSRHDKHCLALQPLPTGHGYWHCTCGLSKIVLDGELLESIIAESEKQP